MHALASVALFGAETFIPAIRIWPLFWLLPLAAYATLVVAVPPLRATFRPWGFGHVSAAAVIATLFIAVGSCGVLVAYHTFSHPDVSAYGSFLPVSKIGGVLVFGALFSILNAFFEEVIFRCILFDAVESQWGVWVAVAATALLFGYGHLRGYPPGPLGGILAGVFGLCLGWLRVFSGGIGLPVMAHIAADATIYCILVHSGAF